MATESATSPRSWRHGAALLLILLALMWREHKAEMTLPVPSRHLAVGRTMFETWSLPAPWVPRLNEMDEIWVPTEFNVDSFRRAGVTVPLHVVPGGIDADVYRPDAAPLDIPGLRSTVFLSVFEWTLRKGWDVLLEAWAEAFDRDDDAQDDVRRSRHLAQAVAGGVGAEGVDGGPDHSAGRVVDQELTPAHLVGAG